MSEPQAVQVFNHTAAGVLEIAWSDGMTGIFAHRLLRESCRCAYCLASARRGQPIVASDGTRILDIEPWGGNTLRLVFNDGHGRGIFPFDYLRTLLIPGA